MIPSASGQKGNLHGKIININVDVKYLLEGYWLNKINTVKKKLAKKQIFGKKFHQKKKKIIIINPILLILLI